MTSEPGISAANIITWGGGEGQVVLLPDVSLR